MKKIFLFSICTLLLVDNVFATCGQSTLGFDGIQEPHHDEFLYIDKDQYDLTVAAYKHTNKQTSGSGYGYECDTTHSAGCDRNDEVTLPAGHFFKGVVVDQSVTYVCKGGVNDRWVAQETTADACDVPPFGKLLVGKQFSDKTIKDCSGINKTEENVGLVKTWAIICRPGRTVVCKPTECVKDYEVNNKTGKCDFIGCPDCDKIDPKPNSCKESRKTEEGKACCDLSSKVAKWDGKNCLCQDINKEFKIQKGKGVCVAKQQRSCKDLYKGNTEAIACCEAGENWIDGKCECSEENKVWDSKLKKCVEKSSPVPSIECTKTDCKITINQTIRCFNNSNYFNSTENYSVCKEDLDALSLDCNELKKRVNACQNTDCIRGLLTRIDAFDELIAKVCKDSTNPVYVPDNSAKIAAAKQTVSSFFGSAESNKSVWKDTQGNFNTARLASDLTAGVVLGTVGGVVSGVVIKKKQIEKGFDALHCAVGGQTVADWGDTFNVGLRR